MVERREDREVGFSPFQANLLQGCVMNQFHRSVPIGLLFFQGLSVILYFTLRCTGLLEQPLCCWMKDLLYQHSNKKQCFAASKALRKPAPLDWQVVVLPGDVTCSSGDHVKVE